MADENTFPDLIREYAEKGEIDNIISLCVAMKDQRDRAERKIDILTHMTQELNQRFRNIVEPATGRKVTDPAPAPSKVTTTRTKQGAQPQKKDSKPTVDTSSFTF